MLFRYTKCAVKIYKIMCCNLSISCFCLYFKTFYPRPGLEAYRLKVIATKYLHMYRAVSGVFQNIDPQPLLHPASVSSPRTKGGRVHSAHSPGGEGVGGQYFGRRQTRHWIGLSQYNLSIRILLVFIYFEDPWPNDI